MLVAYYVTLYSLLCQSVSVAVWHRSTERRLWRNKKW